MFENLVAFEALQRPDEIAIDMHAGGMSFERLEMDVRRLAKALDPHVEPGCLVAVRFAGQGVHWLLLLALARLGCATASLATEDQDTTVEMIAALQPSLVLTDVELSSSAPTLQVTAELLQAAIRSPAPAAQAVHAFASDEIVRVILKRGEGSVLQPVALTRAAVDARILNASTSPLGEANLICALAVHTEGGYIAPFAAWARGHAVTHPERRLSWPILLSRKHRQVLIADAPGLLTILRQVPGEQRTTDGLILVVYSEAPTPALALRAAAALGALPWLIYGSPETGIIAGVGPRLLQETGGLTLALWPSADVDVVDSTDSSVPLGQIGQVLVRCDGPMGVAEIPAAKQFRSGEIGTLSADRILTMFGSEEDLTEIDGAPLSLNLVEAILVSLAGVADAGVFVDSQSAMAMQVHAALIVQGHFNLPNIEREFAVRLPRLKPRFWIVDNIPRLPSGRTDRASLRARIGPVVQATMSASSSNTEPSI